MAPSPLSTTGRTSFKAPESYASRSNFLREAGPLPTALLLSLVQTGRLMTYLGPFYFGSLYRDSDEMIRTCFGMD